MARGWVARVGTIGAAAVAAHALAALGCASSRTAQAPTPQTAPAAAAAPAMVPARVDTFAAQRDSLMNVVLRSIAGRENAPAESVFKNIRAMRGMPAGRLVRVMNMGFGRSLGVGCAHCHVTGEWDKEDKPQKEVTRGMLRLVTTVNGELTKLQGLKSERPVVNCTTCHRGQIKPALDL